MTITAPVDLRWLGHSCVEVELGGVRVLTDPALTSRLAHLRRHHLVEPGTIHRPDVVVISHVHTDHLHQSSLRRFDRSSVVVVPAGAEGLVRGWGFRDVRPTRAGDVVEHGALRIETVRAVHPRSRGPHSRVAADPVGYVLRAGDTALYFAGDTDGFAEMAALAPLDLALLPIWGWGPSLGPGHLDPVTAAGAVRLLRPDVVVPIHWGTYSPIGMGRPAWLDTPPAQFRAALAAIGADSVLRVLTPGASLTLGPPLDGRGRAERSRAAES